MKNTQGKIHAITGYGKGKSSSAFGTALRAIQNDWKVLIVQFCKCSMTAEVELIKDNFSDKVTIKRYGVDKIVLPNNLTEIDKSETQKGWDGTMIWLSQNHVDLLILDEVFVALDLGLLQQYKYFDFLKGKPEGLEVISTGRVTDKALMHKITLVSDLHSDIYCKAHYFNRKCSKCRHEWDYWMEFCPTCGVSLGPPTFARNGIEQ